MQAPSPAHPQKTAAGVLLRSGASCFGGQLAKALLAASLGLVATTALAAGTVLPPLVQPASQEHHAGKVVLVELVTPDLASAEKFYAGMFGWTFQELKVRGFEYAQASLDGQPVAGLVQRPVPAGQQRQPFWLSFLSVNDADAAKATALQHGAKILFEPHTIANRGREAVLADPQGAVFAVLASSSGDPPDELAGPGAWIWSSLITRDPDVDAAFYQALFGYEVFDLSDDDKGQHMLLSSDNYARASANSLPADKPGIQPHWLNFVRVENAADAAQKAVSLGGRVLVEPRPDRQGGKLAVVADSQGAVFGLLEWSDAQGKEVSQ
jgi:predicted enzyme related to lactoylglutathione lyase